MRKKPRKLEITTTGCSHYSIVCMETQYQDVQYDNLTFTEDTVTSTEKTRGGQWLAALRIIAEKRRLGLTRTTLSRSLPRRRTTNGRHDVCFASFQERNAC